jgi:hypothetical protein
MRQHTEPIPVEAAWFASFPLAEQILVLVVLIDAFSASRSPA